MTFDGEDLILNRRLASASRVLVEVMRLQLVGTIRPQLCKKKQVQATGEAVC